MPYPDPLVELALKCVERNFSFSSIFTCYVVILVYTIQIFHMLLNIINSYYAPLFIFSFLNNHILNPGWYVDDLGDHLTFGDECVCHSSYDWFWISEIFSKNLLGFSFYLVFSLLMSLLSSVLEMLSVGKKYYLTYTSRDVPLRLGIPLRWLWLVIPLPFSL